MADKPDRADPATKPRPKGEQQGKAVDLGSVERWIGQARQSVADAREMLKLVDKAREGK